MSFEIPPGYTLKFLDDPGVEKINPWITEMQQFIAYYLPEEKCQGLEGYSNYVTRAKCFELIAKQISMVSTPRYVLVPKEENET